MVFVHRLIRFLHRCEDAILILILLALMSLAFGQIVMRNLFDGGWLWVDSAVRVLLLWVALWGASVAGRNGRHIRIELASHYLPSHWKPYVTAVCDIACAIISAIVAWHSAVFVLDEYHYGDIAFLNVPVWMCEIVIPIAFALLALRFLMQGLFTAFKREDALAEAADT